MNEYQDHIPVLTKEVLQYLDLQPNDNVIDGTVGNGGHANVMLQKTAPFGKLLGIDVDAGQIVNARRATHDVNERLVLVNDSYAHLREIAERVRLKPIHAILLDLGYSSWHVSASGKGFSFLKNEPLDMRYGGGELTAAKMVNEWPEKELARVMAEYGEEKYAKQIARSMVRQRRAMSIKSTFDLVKILEEAVGAQYQQEKIHCATRTFQALRVAVNGELDNLQKALPQALEILAEGGRLAVISFHSLEDRIVKQFFQKQQQEHTLILLTKKPVMAGDEELAANPRSRSAKLRAIIKR